MGVLSGLLPLSIVEILFIIHRDRTKRFSSEIPQASDAKKLLIAA